MKNLIITQKGKINQVENVLNIDNAVALINQSVDHLEASASGNIIEVENFYDLTEVEIDSEKQAIKTLLESWIDLYVTKFQVTFNC